MIVLLLVRPSQQPPLERTADVVEETPYTPPGSDGFLGSARCAECHQEIYASYSQHPMYNSTRHVSADTNPPPSSTTSVFGINRSLAATTSENGTRHHERMHDADGKLIYSFAIGMDFVVGSGRRAKAYLHQRDGLICTSPLNWFTDEDWDLNPGFAPDDPRRFDRQATAECLTCHAGHLALIARGVDEFRQQAFHEMAIGCERCHGPGKAHSEYHKLSNVGEDPIVQMAKLTSKQQRSICYQCHFSATNRVLRTSRAVTDFRPGMDVEHIWSFTQTKPTVDAGGRATSVATAHVQQMHESTCFSNSDGKLNCVSCHDPHSVPTVEERVTFYRERCLSCHEKQACSETPSAINAVNRSCIDCHMPKRGTTMTTHVAQTDHRILRDGSSQPVMKTRKEPIAFFDNHDKRLPDWELRRAIALTRMRAAPPFSITLEDELKALSEHFPEDPEVIVNYGAVCQSRRSYPAAIGAFEKAAQFEATAARAYEALMQITYESSDFETALQYADQYIEISRWSALVHAIRGDCLHQLGQPKEAAMALEQCLQLNPSIIQVQQALGELYGELGLPEKQRTQQKLIDRMKTARPSTDVSDLK